MGRCEPQTQQEASRVESTQRLASATKVADTGNEGIARARHNKLEVIRVMSEQDPPRRETKSVRTLRVCLDPGSPLLSRRFQRTLAPLKRSMFIRLVRLGEIILRYYGFRGFDARC